MVKQRAAAAVAPAIRYLHVPERGKSAAVNRALEVATGEILALTDDDVAPETDWIASIAAAFEDAAIDFVAGRILPLWEAPPPRWMSPALYGVLAVPDNGLEPLPLDGSTTAVVPIGANMAVRRRLLERIGGLRTDFGKLEDTLRTGEDHEWYLRMLAAGFRGVYQPRVLVRHRVPAERLARRYFRGWLYQNGRDVARLDREYASSVRRWLGVPRYLWRQAAVDLWSAVAALASANGGRRFAAAVRLLWFSGYVREVWFGSLLGAGGRAVALEGGR
jgi:cellulose synthase/poly-beta-1,6-N-acetylglucosamine synthase-like glycosyltransferase